MQALLSGVDVAACIEFHPLVFVDEAEVGDDAAGLGVGCDDVSFVAIVV